MKLIINADDAGIDSARNQGIFETVDGGSVKSLSAVVNQGGWEDLIARSKKFPYLGIGLHFNLTAGKPLAKDVKTLVNSQGDFFNKFELFKKAMDETLEIKEIIREFKAQLKIFNKLGRGPSHFDGHNHIHLLPGIREAFFEVVPAGSWVRFPYEKRDPSFAPNQEDPRYIWGDTDHLVTVINYLSVMARRSWKNKFRYPDDFTGTKITPHPSFEKFKKAIKVLKGEVVELMCHPGSEPQEDSVPFSRLRERQVERDILISEEFKDFLAEKNLEPLSFRDLSLITEESE